MFIISWAIQQIHMMQMRLCHHQEDQERILLGNNHHHYSITYDNNNRYNEFIAAMSEHRIKFDTLQLQEVFKRLDVFHTGEITLQGITIIPNHHHDDIDQLLIIGLKEVLKHEGMASNADGSAVTDDDLVGIFKDVIIIIIPL